MDQPAHTPVLLAQALSALGPRPGETYVDATAGLGGHALAAAEAIGPTGLVVLNDLDPQNLARAAERVRALRERGGGPEVEAIHGGFADLPRALGRRGIVADALLADLGFASSQMEDPGRGFSIRLDGPLDMRLDPGGPVTAAELVNTLPESELRRIFKEYGEEPAAGRIARRIVERRLEAPIERTGELANLVREAVGPGRSPRAGLKAGQKRSSIDPATRAFQALRIAVNDELASLASLLGAIERAARSQGRRPDGEAAEAEAGEGQGAERTGASGSRWLSEGARVAVISFHSLEDRLVKRSFAGLVRAGLATPVTDGAAVADAEEVRQNPRSRSARLRGIRLGRSG